MDFKNLSDDMKKKIAECKSTEDYLSCAKEIGYKLSDEDLDKINGGGSGGWSCDGCPVCKSSDVQPVDENNRSIWHCNSCGVNFPLL